MATKPKAPAAARPKPAYRLASSGAEPAPQVHTRLRSPHAALKAILGNDGNVDDGDGGKITTQWVVENANDRAQLFVIEDRQDEDDKGFRLTSFRRRPAYDWHVSGPSKPALDDFCRWLSDGVLAWLHEQPRGRRLTEAAKAKINELVRAGKSAAEATREAAEWEEVSPPIEDFRWPIKGKPRDD